MPNLNTIGGFNDHRLPPDPMEHFAQRERQMAESQAELPLTTETGHVQEYEHEPETESIREQEFKRLRGEPQLFGVMSDEELYAFVDWEFRRRRRL